MTRTPSWQVHEHGPLEPLEDNLWTVRGSLPGMALRRRMAVVRLPDGRLVIHGAIALDDPSMARLEALGEPAYLIVPNGFHRLDAPGYAARYPEMEVLCPAAARRAVEKRVAVTGDLDRLPH